MMYCDAHNSSGLRISEFEGEILKVESEARYCICNGSIDAWFSYCCTILNQSICAGSNYYGFSESGRKHESSW